MLPLLLLAAAAHAPIALHPDNPHYFLFRGKPTVLITSGEHYGAVLNLDFDYVRYLDALQADGLNLTRTFSGALLRDPGRVQHRRQHARPGPGRSRRPGPAATQPGYADGGNKFDLTRWDDGLLPPAAGLRGRGRQRGRRRRVRTSSARSTTSAVGR